MRVSSIQAYGVNSAPKMKRNVRAQVPPQVETPKADTVAFKSKAGASAVGATLGGILGAATIAFISGGAAIPFVVGAYTVGGAAAGASLGSMLGDDDNGKNNKED